MSQQKRVKRAISGWLILNKPYDMTSTQAVGKIKWLFEAKKAGHAGTLDPLATGILPIALGEATKTVPFVQDGTKIYEFDMAWGSATTTDDVEGEVIETSDHRPTEAELIDILPCFTGIITQIPPAFSAIKIKGERAYDLARAGEKPDMPPREIEIESLEVLAHGNEFSTLRVTCQKGTYVRALARDIAQKLGSVAHVSRLHRAAVGPFTEDDAISIDVLEACEDIQSRDEALRPIGDALGHLDEVSLDQKQAQAVRMGNPALLLGRHAPISLDLAYATHRGDVLALGRVEKGQFKPSRVILPDSPVRN
ncbi:tRNA pseudouridine(55) synthase TruB [Maritalea mediterranea]|uniref:tRNA pseudouridine synthase B n=1 Tax=Maritalea mediterranea TaxID=2909667 RepID=A0ABS9E2B3_9HYPH|nr:tRNA pseudouridine(55) synthase TruB [Maritalea mediterranea]MCF4097011.1 tRNA pseudouridine(55) synthase TruB [Maritalea mediterranea]